MIYILIIIGNLNNMFLKYKIVLFITENFINFKLIMIAYTVHKYARKRNKKFHIHCFINQDIDSFTGSESKEYSNCYIIWIICCIWIWLNFLLFIIKLWSWINSHWVSWELSREKNSVIVLIGIWIIYK